jgi:chorismate synthase
MTTGESHGQYLAVIIEGMPSGLRVNVDDLNAELAKRQKGYGRGGRQSIESDTVEILGGIIRGVSTGAPVGFLLKNKDGKINELPELYRPRPGHADLAGALKYHQGVRAVLERASARETAMRVAAGALAKLFLKEFGIGVAGHVVQIGPAKLDEGMPLSAAEIAKRTSGSEVGCICRKAEKKMKAAIDAARRKKDTLGGKYEIVVSGVPVGLGSYVHHEKKLDGLLAQHLMSIQSVKAVEFGLGERLSALLGSQAHDEIFYGKKEGYSRRTNRAGGIEGGVTTGSDLRVRVTMKPIATVGSPLRSVDVRTKKPEKADYERSDICAVPAGCVIGENAAAFTIAGVFLEKFGGDSLVEIKRNYAGYLSQIRTS